MTINNTDAKNGFDVPVTQWGATFGFDLDYVDPPGTTPSDMSVTLQKAGQADLTLFDIQFNPAGQATLFSTTPGVTITPQTGTPPLGNPPVPEASTTVSFGLLLVLGGLMAAAKRKNTRGAG